MIKSYLHKLIFRDVNQQAEQFVDYEEELDTEEVTEINYSSLGYYRKT